jgi:hypothetical protein
MSPSSSNSISESVRGGYQYACVGSGYLCQARTSTKVGDTAVLIIHIKVSIAVDRSGTIVFVIRVHSFDGALQSLRGSGQLVGLVGGLVFSGVVNGLLGGEGIGCIVGEGGVDGGMVNLQSLLRGRVRRQQFAFAGDGRRGCDMWRQNSRQGRLYDGRERVAVWRGAALSAAWSDWRIWVKMTCDG